MAAKTDIFLGTSTGVLEAWPGIEFPLVKEVSMKSLVLLWSVLAKDLASACHTSTDRDIRTVAGREEHEGTSFLTITLPAFGKAFDKALQEGTLTTTSFRKVRSGLPMFLSGFLRQVFNADGVILPQNEISVDAVEAVRQLCYVFQKIELRCSPEREQQALDSFCVADEETGIWDDSSPDHDYLIARLKSTASLLFRDVLGEMDRKVWLGDITPGHGPGTTADRLLGNKKYDLLYWPRRLEAEFPYGEYGVPSPRFDMFCRWGRVLQPDSDAELPARVILVPKTLKTPRVISAEPAAMQWIQQGLAKPLVSLLEADDVVGPLIGFTDQNPNRMMAREGSIHGHLATLDLKEASDRVSYDQVTGILGNWPWFSKAITSCRSNLAALPNGDVITLRKFAPMGSALCFPLEAMVFLTAVFVGIEDHLIRTGKSRLGSRSAVKRFHGLVRVYGDDIIVPVEFVEAISEVFRRLNWRINFEKSFFEGDFRESCGGDYFRGEDVTPVKLRRTPPTSRLQVSEIESFVAFRNLLFLKGRWKTCQTLDQMIGNLIPFPLVSSDSPILGRLTSLPHEEYLMPGDKWDKDLHHIVRKGLVASNKIPLSTVSGVGALLKTLLVTSEQSDHLERAGRPVARKAKLRFGRPY